MPTNPDTRSRWRGDPLAPGRIVFIYAAVGALWVLFSDQLLALLTQDRESGLGLQTFKGWLYVLVTAALLHVLIRRYARGIERLHEELRATVDSMADGVLVVDDRGRVVEANAAAVALFGAADKSELLRPVEELSRRFPVTTLDGLPVPLERFATARALAGDEASGLDAVVRRPDGREIALAISAAPVRERGARQPRLAVAILRDVSEARRLERMGDDLLVAAAHELKTPLAVVKAYAQLMKKRADGDLAPLDVVVRQVDRLSLLVQRLLEFSRFRLSPAELERSPFELEAAVRDVVGRMRPLADRHAIRVDRAAGASVVRGDRTRIEQVVANLIDNALRFSPEGGDVVTAVDRRDREVVVSVKDQGLGIPPERQCHVFQRYYRAHAGTAHDFGGIGVGLDVCREIVARHGGRMWFESEAGAGSTFYFSLPVEAVTPGERAVLRDGS